MNWFTDPLFCCFVFVMFYLFVFAEWKLLYNLLFQQNKILYKNISIHILLDNKLLNMLLMLNNFKHVSSLMHTTYKQIHKHYILSIMIVITGSIASSCWNCISAFFIGVFVGEMLGYLLGYSVGVFEGIFVGIFEGLFVDYWTDYYSDYLKIL